MHKRKSEGELTETIGLVTADYNEVDRHGSSELHSKETQTPDSEGGQVCEDSKSQTLRTLSSTPGVIIVLANQWIFTFSSMSATILLPLMWSTSIEHGGLGFTPYKTGVTLGIYGIASAVVQFRFFGKVLKRLGPQKVYAASAISLLVHFVCFPLSNILARYAGRVDWKVWCVIIVQLVANAAVPTTYGKSCL